MTEIIQNNLEFGVYESALMTFKSNLEKFNNDFKSVHDYQLIETIKCRIKTQESIKRKLERKNLPYSYDAILKSISDIAGMRIICPFIDDVYFVVSYISNLKNVTIELLKDYIQEPKPNGYRSIHLKLKYPVEFNDYTEYVSIEVQIRTIAMDFWATLEHQLVYKNKQDYGNRDVFRELCEYAQMISTIDKRMQILKRSDFDGKDFSRRR